MSEDDTPPADHASDRAENMRRYRKAYWERFSQTRRRVYGTLSASDYERIEARARESGRAVWAQLHAEAEAYARGDYLPPREIEARITELIIELRRIGTNVNQITREFHRKGSHDEKSLLFHLADLEALIHDFVKKPWGLPPDDDPPAPP